MGRNISLFEMPLADVVVVPKLSSMKGTDFKSRNTAIIAGEEAMQQQMDLLKKKIDEYYRNFR
jgi:NTE family protein